MLEPIGNQVLVRPEPEPSRGAIWTPPQGELAKQATVICGNDEFAVGDRVIIAMRQAIQVGDSLLVPTGGILARLELPRHERTLKLTDDEVQSLINP